MINNLIKFSVFNRGVVLVLTLLLVFAGFYSFQHLPIDAVPDITNNQVQINTVVDGLAPEEIESLITLPIESAVNGTPGVVTVRSASAVGISTVKIIFDGSINGDAMIKAFQLLLNSAANDYYKTTLKFSGSLADVIPHPTHPRYRLRLF